MPQPDLKVCQPQHPQQNQQGLRQYLDLRYFINCVHQLGLHNCHWSPCVYFQEEERQTAEGVQATVREKS